MTQIRCPVCDATGNVDRPIEDDDFVWSCAACFKTFEVRTVFLRRVEPVDKQRFSTEVRAELERQRLTQAELGRLIGVSGAYISTILSGRREVSRELAERVNRALRVDVRE